MRKQLADALKLRMQATLPAALRTLWQGEHVVVAIEEIKFLTPAWVDGDFEALWKLEGMVVADLIGDNADSIDVAPLLVDLVKPLTLQPSKGLSGPQYWLTAILQSQRDVAVQGYVAHRFRFSVSGHLVSLRTDSEVDAIPEHVYAGYSPDLGTDGKPRYEEVS